MESPEYVRLSTAAAIALGLERGRFYLNAYPYCINLLLHFSDGCKANCLYCGQAREIAKSSACKTLIRVDWPLYELDEVIERYRERFAACGCSARPYRVCVATITNSRAVEAEIEVIRRVWEELRVPISALVTPTLFGEEEFRELKKAGAERAGIAIDCASERIFDLLRGRGARGPHRWDRYLEGVEEAVEVFGRGKVGIHLIVGLGETEREAVELIQWAHDAGAETHLFAFYPEEGTPLEDWPRPPIGQYRRVQLARYLIDGGMARAEDMEFNEHGQVVDFGISGVLLDEVIEGGLPFVTSGCPGCNRPYANERPGEPVLRNYPYVPSGREIEEIRRQLRWYAPPYNSLERLEAHLSERSEACVARRSS